MGSDWGEMGRDSEEMGRDWEEKQNHTAENAMESCAGSKGDRVPGTHAHTSGYIVTAAGLIMLSI